MKKKPIKIQDVTWKVYEEDISIVNQSIQYFSTFFDDAITKRINQQSNLNALQEYESAQVKIFDDFLEFCCI